MERRVGCKWSQDFATRAIEHNKSDELHLEHLTALHTTKPIDLNHNVTLLGGPNIYHTRYHKPNCCSHHQSPHATNNSATASALTSQWHLVAERVQQRQKLLGYRNIALHLREGPSGAV